MKSTGAAPGVIRLVPIHGHAKLRTEGYRTRDAHVLEWVRALEPEARIEYHSRPEPQIKRLIGRAAQRDNDLPGVHYEDTFTWRIPTSRIKSKWWVQSADLYQPERFRSPADVTIVWNPLTALGRCWPTIRENTRHLHFDFLDDWSVHYAFSSIKNEVIEGYRRSLKDADSVSANSEATLEYALRAGREDAQLVPNGVDPHRFSAASKARDDFTVGYVGKIGARVDSELVVQVASMLPDVHFVFAGPVLDGNFHKQVSKFENVEWLGDVHYDDVPELLTTFDLGWIPHNVGKFEVGGDVIKTYEYRAAGLEVLSTPIIGIGNRAFNHVSVLPRQDHAAAIKKFSSAGRLARQVEATPDELTWESRVRSILELCARE